MKENGSIVNGIFSAPICSLIFPYFRKHELMPVFTYIAKDASHSVIKGTIAGDSPRHARDLIRERGLSIVHFEEGIASTGDGFVFPIWRQNASKYVAVLTGDLSTLLTVGVPLLQALETLEEQYAGAVKQSVTLLKDQIASGKNLAEAMAAQPETFDRLCLKMVEVGENTGKTDEVLRQLSEFKRKSNQIQDRVLTSMLYPLIILAVSIGVSVFLMTFVIPMLLENLAETGKKLPWPTRVLKSFSDFLSGNGLIVLGGVGALGVGATTYLRTNNGTRFWYSTLRKIPVLGPMNQKQEIARVSQIISTLSRSGVEFLDAIELAIGTSKNPLLRDALEACAKQIRSGKDIGKAMGQTKFFPPMVVQIYTIGQQSGKIGDMLQRLAEDFDQQVDSLAAKISTVIEPILILILSVFVGFILYATLLPMLESGNAILS